MHQKQYLEILDPFHTIAIINVYDVSIHNEKPAYVRTDIAVNNFTDKLQILVTSNTPYGISQFYSHYPDAEKLDTGILPNPSQWKSLVYPHRVKVNKNSAPIDDYLQAVHRKKLRKS